MNEKDELKLALRVFKRSNNYLVLLWRRLPGADPTKTEISFKEISEGKNPEIKATKFKIDEPLLEGNVGEVNVDRNTVACVLEEEENNLDAKKVYYVKVTYGGLSEGIRLTPAGVFPSHEREDRKKNVHLMAWDDDSQCWRKITGVKGPKGRFYLGVVQLPCPDCGTSQQ